MTQNWKNRLHNKREISKGNGNSFFSRKNANPCRWNRKLILQISVATFSVWWENALIFWRRLMQFGKLNFLATLGRREKLLLSGRKVRTRLYSSSLAKSSWNLKTLIMCTLALVYWRKTMWRICIWFSYVFGILEKLPFIWRCKQKISKISIFVERFFNSLRVLYFCHK